MQIYYIFSKKKPVSYTYAFILIFPGNSTIFVAKSTPIVGFTNEGMSCLTYLYFIIY